MDFETSVEFEDVSVLMYAGRNLICRINRRRVRVAPVLILPGSDVRAPGDRGKLVIPRWLAVVAKLIEG
jgi:hypothetical protein